MFSFFLVQDKIKKFNCRIAIRNNSHNPSNAICNYSAVKIIQAILRIGTDSRSVTHVAIKSGNDIYVCNYIVGLIMNYPGLKSGVSNRGQIKSSRNES